MLARAGLQNSTQLTTRNSKNVNMRDDNGTAALFMQLMPQSGLDYIRMSYSGEATAIRIVPSEALPTYPAGWIVVTHNANQLQGILAWPRSTARMVGGANTAIVAGEYPAWIPAGRFYIGTPTGGEQRSVEFRSSYATQGRHAVGAIVWNTVHNDLHGWRTDTAGSPGTGSPFGPGYVKVLNKNVNYTLDGLNRFVSVDSSAAARTITLPATPTAGEIYDIVDAQGTAGTNNITIARNGKMIRGAAADLVLDVNWSWCTIYWDATNSTWLYRVTT